MRSGPPHRWRLPRFLCLAVGVWACVGLVAIGAERQEFRVFRVATALSMDDGVADHPGPDYYLDGGSTDGLAEGMLLSAYRPSSFADPNDGTTHSIRIRFGRVRLIRVYDEISIARSVSIEPSTNAPLVTPRAVMIGDVLVVESAGDSSSASYATPSSTFSLPAHVLFDLDSSKLKPTAARRLAELNDRLAQQPWKRIVVEGRTCDLGSEQYNRSLSVKRARAVAEYLAQAGRRPKERITVVGLGESSPLAPNTSEEQRRRNRRVDVHLVSEARN